MDILKRLREGRTEGTDLRWQVSDSHLEAADEIERLRNALRAPLSMAELKLVDKNCDWLAFKHAWNAVMKSRLAQLETKFADKNGDQT